MTEADTESTCPHVTGGICSHCKESRELLRRALDVVVHASEHGRGDVRAEFLAARIRKFLLRDERGM